MESQISRTQLVLFTQLFELVQIAGGAERRVHFVRVVEETVIDGVLAGILAEGDERLETVSPLDLGRQVGRARLCRHARRLHCSFQNDDDLKLLFQQIRGGYVVERRVGRDFVNDRHRPDEEDVALVVIHSALELQGRTKEDDKTHSRKDVQVGHLLRAGSTA